MTSLIPVIDTGLSEIFLSLPSVVSVGDLCLSRSLFILSKLLNFEA